MSTGDGLLARVHPPLGILSAMQIRAVAEAARRYGNGHVDVTARGNLQVRGVGDATACHLAGFLAEAGLGDVRADGGPQRLTLTSPLAGLDASEWIDVPALARAVEDAGLVVPGLPAKTLVAIDGGGRWSSTDIEADVFVVAFDRERVVIELASDIEPHLSIGLAVGDAPTAIRRVLDAFVATGRRRMRDLDDAERVQIGDMLSEVAGGSAPRPCSEGRTSVAAPEPGLIETSSGLAAALVEVPFGRCEAVALDRLADVAASARSDIPTSPSRGFALIFEDPDAARTALTRLAATGFVTSSGDPRRAVAACPGAPACASGTTPVPLHAAELADAFAPFAARGLKAHVSGCAKGCAHPRKAGLTLVGEAGRYRVVVDGAPEDGARAPSLTFEAALDRVRRADPARCLAGAFGP